MNDQPNPTFVQRALYFTRRYFLWIVSIMVLGVLVLVFEAGRYSVYRVHPELSSVEKGNEILEKVGKLIQLPNEQPTMASIDDAASAKKAQPFLANAQNGDVLIVYPNAAEAILYRPSTDKLIAVGPVSNQPSSAQTQAAPVATSTDHATTSKKK